MALRSPSLIKFEHLEVLKIITPGRTAVCGAT
jgi:hypothetical protein